MAASNAFGDRDHFHEERATGASSYIEAAPMSAARLAAPTGRGTPACTGPLTAPLDPVTIEPPKMTRALSFVLPLFATAYVAAPRRAFAEDTPPCATEATAVKNMKQRDPSLAYPKDARAREHLEAGRRAFGVQAYDRAAEEYTSAGLNDDAPLILYNLGQTYRAAKAYEKAIRQYDLFLDRGKPGPEVRALVLCHIATMKAELEHAASTAPPTGPAADQTGPGTTRRDGILPVQPQDVARRATLADSPRESTDTSRDRPGGDRPAAAWYDDHFGLALTGIGAVGVVVGGALLLDARSLDDKASMTASQQQHDQLRDQARTRTLFGGAAGISGAGLLTIGIIKLAMHRSSNATAWNMTISPNGVVAFGRF